MEAVILVGIQGAGKSTFYQGHFCRTHLRINLDMLKTRSREARFVKTCLETKQRFVVDNTNPTKKDRARYIESARGAGFRVLGYYFPPEIEDSIRRNASRPGKECVPVQAVHATRARLEPPTYEEGFDELFEVLIAGGQFVVKKIPEDQC